MSRQAESDQPNSEFANFTNALKKVLSVSRSELQAKLQAEKKRKRSHAKTSPSGRASHGKA